MTVALVFAGAMVGAPLRYLVDRFVQARHDSLVPWGTITVNLTGCLILGALTGAGSALPGSVLALAGTGFCGALTTYSTFSFEALRLIERKAYRAAAVNIAVSVVAGLGATLLGHTAVGAVLAA